MFLSIVVPVYNTEKYLDDCLLSLLMQDIAPGEYEVICVNDGSRDKSPEILRRYEEKYPNVRVIDQPNGGVCRARNAGLTAARGEYIWYVDSDDFILENCLGALRKSSENGKYDRIIVGQVCFWDREEERKLTENAPWFDSVVSRSLLKRQFLLENDLFFHYPDLKYGEDAMMVYEIKRYAPKTIHVDTVVYFYRVRPDSAVTTLGTRGNNPQLRANIAEAKIMKAYYERRDGILTEQTANRFMSFLWGALYRMSLLPCDEARLYLEELKKAGLYPYKRPAECTLVRCPEVKRDDLVGKVFDVLYTNLSARWGYVGMRVVHRLFQLKERIKGRS